MSDVWALGLAVAAFAGAVAGADGHLPALPFVLAVLGVGVALALRRPLVLCLAVAALAGGLAQRSVAGLTPPPSGPVHGEVTLASDPEPDGRGGVTADVRWEGRRLRAAARSAAGAALDDRLTGERVTVIGRVGPPGWWERMQRHRHLAGRLEVETVVGWRPGHAVTRGANGLRRTLAAGAEVLPERQRSLLAGLTLGDDRDQPPDMADAFEAAGLTHLLAVSGSNVAFALVVASPMLVRLRFGPRLAATLAVLAGFALVTRFEPSVLRATAMASVAATGAALGRPSSSRRALGLGVAAILLVDPLLATSLGFQLSAAGAAGIVVGAQPVERALPGPRWLRAPLAVTIAAQLAVSPLLVATFGSLPLASLPANVLAEPVAGPIMVWGLTAGLAAGVLGGPIAMLLHLPTRAMLWWLDTVASTLAAAPLGVLRMPHMAAALAAVALLALAAHTSDTTDETSASGPGPPEPAAGHATARAHTADAALAAPSGRERRRPARLRAAGALLSIAALVPAVRPPSPGAPGASELGLGATVWQGERAVIVVLDGRARPDLVLGGLREHGVRQVDAVVVRSAARATADAVGAVRARWPTAAVLAPPDSPADTTTTPPRGAVAILGDLRLTITTSTPDTLAVEITRP